jgi:hypothetical protein
MLGNAPFYNKTIEKISTVFGMLFSDVTIIRPDSTGALKGTVIKVPIDYAPKNHRAVRDIQNNDLGREVNQTLPRMAFQLTNLEPDNSRQGPTTNRFNAPSSSNSSVTLSTAAPLAYNFEYELYIKINRAADGFQIAEQIITMFRQHLSAKINFTDDLNVPLDVQIKIDNISFDDTYEGPIQDKREIVWTFTFVVLGWLFGPVSPTGIIKYVQVDFHPTMSSPGARVARVSVQPGLTAGGAATSNVAASINYNLINADDPFGICSNIYEFSDGKHYDPHSLTDVL